MSDRVTKEDLECILTDLRELTGANWMVGHDSSGYDLRLCHQDKTTVHRRVLSGCTKRQVYDYIYAYSKGYYDGNKHPNGGYPHVN